MATGRRGALALQIVLSLWSTDGEWSQFSEDPRSHLCNGNIPGAASDAVCEDLRQAEHTQASMVHP